MFMGYFPLSCPLMLRTKCGARSPASSGVLAWKDGGEVVHTAAARGRKGVGFHLPDGDRDSPGPLQRPEPSVVPQTWTRDSDGFRQCVKPRPWATSPRA